MRVIIIVFLMVSLSFVGWYIGRFQARLSFVSFYTIVHPVILLKLEQGDVATAENRLRGLVFDEVVSIASEYNPSSMVQKVILGPRISRQLKVAVKMFKIYYSKSDNRKKIFREIASSSDVFGNPQFAKINRRNMIANKRLAEFLGVEYNVNDYIISETNLNDVMLKGFLSDQNNPENGDGMTPENPAQAEPGAR